MALTWDEVTPDLDARQFTLRNALDRIAAPWRASLDPTLPLSRPAPPAKIAPMQHRVLAAATLAGALWAHGTAAACNFIGPYLGTGPQLPLGCPLHVYFSGPVPISGVPYVPMVSAMRSAGYVDVTGAISMTPDALQVEQMFAPCPRGFQLPPEHRIESYGHFTVSLKNVQVGDQIGLDTGWLTGIAIVAAAPCAASIAPMPACIDMVPCPGDEPPFDDGSGSSGCHAAAGGGLGAGAALLGLRRRARRRR